MSPHPSGRSIPIIWPLLFAGLAVALTIMVRKSLKWGDDGSLDSGGFQLAEAPKADTSSERGYLSKFESEALLRKSPAGGQGLAGLVPEEGLRAPGSSPKTEAGPGKKESGYTPEREREAIRRLDPAIMKEQMRLHRMTSKYKKQHKVVKEVDDYFFGLPRYRALYERYHKDRNLFSFFREAVALPEVRAGVKKYMTDPNAMRVGMMMLAEGLGQPVPKSVMSETFTFLNQDYDMAKYMGTEFWPMFSQSMPSALASAPMPAGGQAAVQGLASALSGTFSAPPAQPQPQSRR